MYDTSHGSRHGSAGAKLFEDTTALNWGPALIGAAIMAASSRATPLALTYETFHGSPRGSAGTNLFEVTKNCQGKKNSRQEKLKARKCQGKKTPTQENPSKEKKH